MAKLSRGSVPNGYSPLILDDGTVFIYVLTAMASKITAAQRQRAEAQLAQSSPVAPCSASTAPKTAKACTKRAASSGRSVPVVDFASLFERRKSIDVRTRFGYDEKKAEIRAIDNLIERGVRRVVGLRKDWRARIERLRSEMPHFTQVIERIEGCCTLADYTGQPLHIPPLLLVGPPGVGKTHFATHVADLLGLPSFVYALESAETTSVLTGSEKHWGNKETGQLFRLIMQGQFANPVIVLDELDKAPTGGSHYRPAAALHAVLEPSTSRHLRDKSIDLTFDASHVIYIATANQLSEIKSSLRSRFEVFCVDEPGPRAAVAVARAIGQQVLRELKLSKRFHAPTGEVIQQLALLGSPRQMHKVFVAAVGRAVVAGRTHVHVADLLCDMPRNGGLRRSTGGREEPLH